MSKATILFADNNLDFLDTRAEFLEDAGYQVLKAYTLEQARQLLVEARVHLAILDIRLVDDDDEKDTSGLTLAKDPAFHPVPKIILTGFPTYQAVREALGSALNGLPPAVGFLAKQEGPEAMIAAVKQALTKHIRLNQNLRFRWGDATLPSIRHLLEYIAPELPAELLPDRAAELEDLFRRLFQDYAQVTVARFFGRRDGRALLGVYAHPVEGIADEYVVSCGLRTQVTDEQARFKRCAPPVGGEGTTTGDRFIETIHFAAVAYSLGGADLAMLTPLAELTHTRPAADALAALDDLLDKTLPPWHRLGRHADETRSWNALYREWLSLEDVLSEEVLSPCIATLKREVLAAGLSPFELTPDLLFLRLSTGRTVICPSPLSALTDQRLILGSPAVLAIQHGGLDGRSVLVGSGGRTWLVDFARAGRGPLYGDSITLESAFKFDLWPAPNLDAAVQLETHLLSSDAEAVPPRAMERIALAVERIRAAADQPLDNPADEYLLGLLYTALGRVAAFDSNVRHTQTEIMAAAHALLSAAMIYGRLSSLAERLSRMPVQALTRLWVEETTKEVWLAGQRLRLTPQEFRIIHFLHQHAGEVCSRKAIVEEGLDETYSDTEIENSRFNSMIGRLRKKTERDPDNPRYLITVRGEGYRLML